MMSLTIEDVERSYVQAGSSLCGRIKGSNSELGLYSLNFNSCRESSSSKSALWTDSRSEVVTKI